MALRARRARGAGRRHGPAVPERVSQNNAAGVPPYAGRVTWVLHPELGSAKNPHHCRAASRAGTVGPAVKVREVIKLLE
jgi:hypothetical protein